MLTYEVEILNRARLLKGLSYTDLANKTGVHKITVARTLSGVTMKPRTVKKLADVLDVDMETIIKTVR